MDESRVTDGDREVLELFVDRKEIGRIESRRLDACSTSERAALARTLQELADTIKENHLEAPPSEVLNQENPPLSVARGQPKEDLTLAGTADR